METDNHSFGRRASFNGNHRVDSDEGADSLPHIAASTLPIHRVVDIKGSKASFDISNRHSISAGVRSRRVAFWADSKQSACDRVSCWLRHSCHLHSHRLGIKTGLGKRRIRQTMAPHFVLALTFLFAIIGISAADPTAYEVLASFGFPEGLLPKTVENAGADYVLDGSGAFELHLEGACKFTIPGSYEVRYDSRIAGSIESDRLHSLSGISVHIFYMWWNIDAITVSGQDLTFQVGPFSSSFPAENFDENPMCSGRSHGHADH
ncbi:hypothetical protein L7F22_017689 [Adiantum nelumboides]|nr:hypothetical protein [Adiantum nelumboides]